MKLFCRAAASSNNPANAATRGVDNLNNEEQVQVQNPAAGSWQLRVRGTSVPTGPQRFSLVSNTDISISSDNIFIDGFE
jgi:hypothetical protein